MAAFNIIYFILCVVLCVFGDVKIPDIDVNPVVLGGRPAAITEAPFMAQYMQEVRSADWRNIGVAQCGACIISDKFVLSAAHCYVGEKRHRHYVLVGADRFFRGQRFNIEKVIPHPNYDDISLDFDVLLIKLQSKIQFSSKVQPIRMADPDMDIEDGEQLDVFGFGETKSGRSSKYLLKASLPYVSWNKCKAFYGRALTERMVCAGKKGKDTCRGDSGGPLVHDNTLVGITSFGESEECGRPSYYYIPGVYASVSKLRGFIDSTIGAYS